jgi:ferric-dicitrate binding protein FerR (iron transport regulator)
MSEERQLIDEYLDGGLTSEENDRLTKWLAADAEHIRQFVRETHLHREIREVMLARPYHDCGLADVENLKRGAVRSQRRLGKRQVPAKLKLESLRVAWSWLWRPAVALAACLLLVGAGIWFFPAAGVPVLAEVTGGELALERAGQILVGTVGARLQAGDIFRTPSNVAAEITFAPEKTRITVQPGTELILATTSRGKRFDLRVGRLKASVARQRPFQPMVVRTPQAEATVLGTKFSLLTGSNATRLEVTEGRVRFARASDSSAVIVSAGKYAIAANGTKLAALPLTGGLLREWWARVTGGTRFGLREDPRFPNHPDGRDTTPDFDLKLAETNQLGIRICGYVHPPVTGDYEFGLDCSLPGTSCAELSLSPNEKRADAFQIDRTGGTMPSKDLEIRAARSRGAVGIAVVPRVAFRLEAGRRYYIEMQILINTRGEAHLAVSWRQPGGTRQPLTGEFLSPFKPK